MGDKEEEYNKRIEESHRAQRELAKKLGVDISSLKVPKNTALRCVKCKREFEIPFRLMPPREDYDCPFCGHNNHL